MEENKHLVRFKCISPTENTDRQYQSRRFSEGLEPHSVLQMSLITSPKQFVNIAICRSWVRIIYERITNLINYYDR